MSLDHLTIACIGLGRMGAGIARNLQASGCRFVVYNRTSAKMEPFAAVGATPARSAREAASTADFVVTSLMDDQSVYDMLSGEEGRPEAAAAGRLFTFVSGEPQVIERARPVLETYTQSIVALGEDAAAAASLKLAGNFFGASLLEILGEAFALAEKRGVLAPFANMLKGFLAPMAEYIDRIAGRNYEEPGFTLDAGLKDVRLILEAAGEVHVPLPFASVIRDKCLAAQAHGLSQQDWCSFTEIARLNAGLPRKIADEAAIQ